MITVDRFIAPSYDRDAWLAARECGVTATQVARASTPSGFAAEIERLSNPEVIVPTPEMEWGSEREHSIAMRVKAEFGVMPNSWLICADGRANRWQLATPDGISLDHTVLSEIKTGGREFTGIPVAHKRQMWWQMYVAGPQTTQTIYTYERRFGEPGSFYPAFDLVHLVFERDEEEIEKLVRVAERLQDHAVNLSEVA